MAFPFVSARKPQPSRIVRTIGLGRFGMARQDITRRRRAAARRGTLLWPGIGLPDSPSITKLPVLRLTRQKKHAPGGAISHRRLSGILNLCQIFFEECLDGEASNASFCLCVVCYAWVGAGAIGGGQPSSSEPACGDHAANRY